jgi:hypothetical protein
VGILGYFKKENAPKGSADRCLTCGASADCPYDAEKVYLGAYRNNYNYWLCAALTNSPDESTIKYALETGHYGRCVFKCDNDVVDRQQTNLLFEGGITAHLTMTAFSEHCKRSIHVHCEKGEIYGDTHGNILTCVVFGKPQKKIDLNGIPELNLGHGGGEVYMAKDIADAMSGKPSNGLTSIDKSMASHFIGFAAERSRLNGGTVERIKL